MSKIRRKGLLLASMCVLVWGTAKAQRSNRAGGKTKDRLKLVLILSRHGVRSPTWTQERLDGYSAQPWPKWSVPPGDLTSRGYQLIGQFGSFDRATLAAQGLFAASGCADAANIYLWADSDQRTVATGHAIAEGLFPGCSPPLHGLAAGEIDPLFHPTAGGVKPAQADAAFAEFARLAERPHAAQQDELLEEMRQVLSGCTPGRSCLPVRMPAVSLLGTPSAGVRGKGDHIVDLRGPMAQASSFAEDFLLEYADGMPMDQVGWGHVNEAQLRRFLALHSAYFALMHRTPALARLEASNLLLHITRTLQQAVLQQPDADAIGSPASKLVVLAGHDTNLAAVAALLGLHWTLDGRNDDTPPGTELAFELWQDDHGAYSVRLTVASQTLHQLRTLRTLTPATPPAHAALTVPGCHAGHDTCPWERFQKIAEAAIDTEDVVTVQRN